MNNLMKNEELLNINGGGVTAKQVLGVTAGIAAGFAFGPWVCAGAALAMLGSDFIDDDNN